MALLENTPRLPTPTPPAYQGEPSTVYLTNNSAWFFLVGAMVNDCYPAGTVFGPYACFMEASTARDRVEIGAFDQQGLDKRLSPAPMPLRLAA